MILRQQQIKEFGEVTKPLIKWLEENCHPHALVIVSPDHAEQRVAVVAGRDSGGSILPHRNAGMQWIANG